jgi:hypothetical protein
VEQKALHELPKVMPPQDWVSALAGGARDGHIMFSHVGESPMRAPLGLQSSLVELPE